MESWLLLLLLACSLLKHEFLWTKCNCQHLFKKLPFSYFWHYCFAFSCYDRIETLKTIIIEIISSNTASPHRPRSKYCSMSWINQESSWKVWCIKKQYSKGQVATRQKIYKKSSWILLTQQNKWSIDKPHNTFLLSLWIFLPTLERKTMAV